MRSFESEALSGSVIEAVGGEVDVLGSDVLEAHLLGEELGRIKPFMFSLAPRSQDEWGGRW
jgi:hypothetical protein